MLLIWREETNPDIWTEAEATNYLELDELGLNISTCIPVPALLPPMIIDVKTSNEPADFFFAGLVFIASEELRAVLEDFKVHAQFLPVKMLRRGRRYTRKTFFFVNLLDVVDCFDYDRSKYRKTIKGVHEIKKLVLDDSRAIGHHLFKVGPLPSAKPNPQAIRDVIRCSSEELATHIHKAGLTGVVFTKPEDRQKYPPPLWQPR